jgi:hypothetical protein
VKNRNAFALSLFTAGAVAAWAGAAHAQWQACGVPVCVNPANQYLPVAASDNAGGVIIAWADHRVTTPTGTTRWMIYAQRLNNLGIPQWAVDGVQVAPDSAVADTAFDQQNPVIVADGSGGAYIAWVDGRDHPYTDIYLQHINGSGAPTWLPLGGGVGVCKAFNVQQNPALVLDGSGGVIAAWQDCRNGTNFDIYAQRVDGSGAPQWTTDGVPLCLAPDGQTAPQMISDGNHGAIVVWTDNRNAPNLDLFCQDVTGSGAVKWMTDGLSVFGAPGGPYAGPQQNPVIVSDGAGGFVIVCEDGRNLNNFDIWAQHIDPTGTRQWPDTLDADGYPVITAANNQNAPSACSDGAGGVIVSWMDYRRGNNLDPDLYIQHLDATGVLQWGAVNSGTAVCTAGGSQQYPNVVPDGASGAIVTWDDGRLGTSMFAQRFNAAGAAQWFADGVPTCGMTYGPIAHSTISDGAGGAIFAWQDGRTTNTDVYAAHVTSGGVVTGAAGVDDATPGDALVLEGPRPNPAHAALSVRFTLPTDHAAALDLIDVGGRLLEHHEVGTLGAGAHLVELGRGETLHAGLYFVRLRQDGKSRYQKATVIP